MTDAIFDVLGMGNAMVDVLSHAEDAFLDELGLAKGTMHLIDEGRAVDIYGAMGPGIEMSGGSAGNTMAGIASLGGRGAFIGKVRDDQLGDVFAHDLQSIGVSFEVPRATEGPATGRCLIFVSPDAQRTMNTYLGAGRGLGPADIDEDYVASARIVYVEGYLWDTDAAKAAVLKAFDAAHGAGRLTSLTLSDPFCVDRFRGEFRDLVSNHLDVVFANEVEIMSLYEVDSFEAAMERARREEKVMVLTRSERGSVVVRGGETYAVEAEPVARVVDTTGAGDLYASGFLHGFTRGLPLDECARLGGVAAAEVISHVGARPGVLLSTLV
ncbi:MAG: adenosine kinase [Micrococcales bacterium 73-13]|nr:MAG: adenosine kinase [Micrococcales bacterium 73-13]